MTDVSLVSAPALCTDVGGIDVPVVQHGSWSTTAAARDRPGFDRVESVESPGSTQSLTTYELHAGRCHISGLQV